MSTYQDSHGIYPLDAEPDISDDATKGKDSVIREQWIDAAAIAEARALVGLPVIALGESDYLTRIAKLETSVSLLSDRLERRLG